MTDPAPRRRLSAPERRAQLEDAAVEVVARVGYPAANADAIARTAGVSKGLLWHYFADLDELMEAAARRAVSVLSEAVVVDLDRSAPVPDLLGEAIRRAARLPATHGPQLRAVRQIALNLRTLDGELRLGASEYDELYAQQAALFREGQRLGQVRADLDPQLLAVTYESAVDAMVDHLLQHPGADAEAYAAHVADVLLHGLAPAETSRPDD